MRPNSNLGYLSALAIAAPVVLENDPQAPAAPASDLVAEIDRAQTAEALASYSDRLPWPKVCNVWCFGTSQEWGYSAVIGGRYPENQRIPNIAASIDPGANRTVINLAQPGSNMHVNPYADPAETHFYYSHFNVFGNVPSNATGVFILVPGWNDFGNSSPNSAVHATPEWRAFYRWAVEALVVRALMDECQGASIYGVSKTGSLPSIAGWDTDLTVNNVAFPTLPASLNAFGFNFREIPGGDPLPYNPIISAGNYIEWTAPGEVSDVAIFFNSGQSLGTPPAGISTGGTATVSVNGVVKATISTGYPHNDLGFGAPIWAIHEFLTKVPAGATIRIDGITGNVAYQFNGFIKPSSDLLRKKTIILSTTPGNTFNVDDELLQWDARIKQEIAGDFYSRGYPVYFSCPQVDFNPATDQNPPGDQAHLTLQANIKNGYAHRRARAVSGGYRSPHIITL